MAEIAFNLRFFHSRFFFYTRHPSSSSFDLSLKPGFLLGSTLSFLIVPAKFFLNLVN